MVAQLGKGTVTKSNAVAHARTSLDGRDAWQESQHGAFLTTSLGLEGLRIGDTCLSIGLGFINLSRSRRLYYGVMKMLQV